MGKFRMSKWQIVLLSFSCIMITFGLFRHEAAIVLNKAIKICFECIGVG